MKKIIFGIVAILISLGAFFINPTLQAEASTDNELNLSAKSYVVIDESGKILVESDSEARREVASICKLMTTLITLERLKDGKLSLDDKFRASEYAASVEGSQAFLDAGSEYTVKDLLKSVIVASANDSAVVLAENLAGSEKSFVRLMNETAKSIGMLNTRYANSTGLPAPEQYSTARDTAIILNKVSGYDLYDSYSNIWMDTLTHPSGRTTELVNTNRMIKYYTYCKTGKTGFTDEAGYCLATTNEKDDFKITCVVLGCNTSAGRFKDSMALCNYAFGAFDSKQILSKGDKIEGNITITNGREKVVEGEISEDYYLTMPKTSDSDVSLIYQISDSVSAPIEKNDKLGEVFVVVGGEVIAKIDIVASSGVAKRSYADIIGDIIDNFAIVK